MTKPPMRHHNKINKLKNNIQTGYKINELKNRREQQEDEKPSCCLGVVEQ